MTHTVPKHFTLGKWGSHDRWACDLCPFDTLDGEGVIMAHLEQVHYPAPPPEPVLIPVYDRWGNLVTPVPEQPAPEPEQPAPEPDEV